MRAATDWCRRSGVRQAAALQLRARNNDSARATRKALQRPARGKTNFVQQPDCRNNDKVRTYLRDIRPS